MSAIDRIVFFGTPEFAVPTLAALVAAGRVPVRVVTQPARPAGRGQRQQDPPVGRWAREQGLPVSQPERGARSRLPGGARDAESRRRGGGRLRADLPARAARPAAPRLRQSPRFAAAALARRLADSGRIGSRRRADRGEHGCGWRRGSTPAPSCWRRRRRSVRGRPPASSPGGWPRPGDGSWCEPCKSWRAPTSWPGRSRRRGATYAPRLTRESGRIDWSLAALEIHHRLRAYTPWPGLTAELRGAPLKISAAEVLEGRAEGAPGTYLGLREGRLAVVCGGGTVLGAGELQRPGKRALRAADFANGERLQAGERFS